MRQHGRAALCTELSPEQVEREWLHGRVTMLRRPRTDSHAQWTMSTRQSLHAAGTSGPAEFEHLALAPQVFRTRHFADVPALHGPALPFWLAAYLADPEVQDSITVRLLLLPVPCFNCFVVHAT